MTSKPITTELRDAFVSVHAGTETSAAWLTFDGETFYNLCDAIDSIHANLERENTSLKAELDRLMGEQEGRDGLVRKEEGKTISAYYVDVVPRFDWKLIALELEQFAEIVRGMAGDDE